MSEILRPKHSMLAPVHIAEDGKFIAILNPQSLTYTLYKVEPVITVDAVVEKKALAELAKYYK